MLRDRTITTRRALALLLGLFLSGALAGCGGKGQDASNRPGPNQGGSVAPRQGETAPLRTD